MTEEETPSIRGTVRPPACLPAYRPARCLSPLSPPLNGKLPHLSFSSEKDEKISFYSCASFLLVLFPSGVVVVYIGIYTYSY